ncbi:HNH endonuclease [Gordonia McavH-238-E]|uniref:HNH endonuclease signature motif containing protein n=1 Tax=Gordonia sp. McavH-238-E TaxID=2917736 RepID=UPI001EF70617|nr:HNH endonuclease signature motif containing protein [Gordonia sp. McavH-238-E]MCG7634567.1 HNH endonuclease [Gordonia sp. McavH-238-E]
MQFGGGGADASGIAPEDEMPLPAALSDTELSAGELVDVITHCASITSAASYRLLTAASLLHEERELEYHLRRNELRDGQASSEDELHRRAADAAAGIDPYAEFGPDGFDQATSELGAALMIPAAQARDLIRTGDVLRYRLMLTGNTLACGRIDQRRFTIAMKRTDYVSDSDMQTVDAHLAEAILARPPMSTTQFTTLVDAIVARHAPDAVRRRRERATRDRHITIAPDRFQPGQARITGSLPVTDAAAFNAQLDAMAASVHPDDPRNKRQRRVDAMIALAAHLDTLPCRCPHCAPVPEPVDLDDTVNEPEMERPSAAVESDDTITEALEPTPTPEPAPVTVDPHAPVPTFHIVVNLSTLLGVDDDPGFLDGHGLIDADTMRSLLADARRSFVTTGIHADAAAESRYTPSRKLQNLVRCGELCCTFPGCDQPVWTTDLDHTTPFDHHSPSTGGATTQRNLKPLCRFHHRIKTFGMWRDYQDEYLTAWFQSPTGHTFIGNAFNGRDLFGYLVPGRPPDHPARSKLADQRETRTITHRREIDAWNAANPPPF